MVKDEHKLTFPHSSIFYGVRVFHFNNFYDNIIQMIHEQIKNQIKEAMKAKDEVRLSVIRGLSAAFVNEAMTLGQKPDTLLSDEQALAVIKRAAKQRKDSIDQFRAGNREDLATKEESELKIIEEFLPAQMSREDIKKIAAAKKTELGIADVTKKGQLIGAIIKASGGQASGDDVKAVVDELFQ